MRRRDKSSLSCCAGQGILCSVCRCSTPRLESVCTPENRFSFDEIFTARKRSLGQGNMFTGVCLSTGGGGLVEGVPAPGS